MTRGVISFVFDDGYEAVYRHVVPALERHGFKGVFALPLEHQAMAAQSNQVVRPWQQWLDVPARGHELAAHGVTHRDLTTLTAADLDTELQRSQQAWGATTLVYPGGAYNDTVIQAASRYFSAARTVQRGFASKPARGPLTLKTFNFTRHNFSLYKANCLALWAWLTGQWLIETYHVVDDTQTDVVHSVTLHDFRRHLAFVACLPLANKTIYEAVRDYHN